MSTSAGPPKYCLMNSSGFSGFSASSYRPTSTFWEWSVGPLYQSEQRGQLPLVRASTMPFLSKYFRKSSFFWSSAFYSADQSTISANEEVEINLVSHDVIWTLTVVEMCCFWWSDQKKKIDRPQIFWFSKLKKAKKMTVTSRRQSRRDDASRPLLHSDPVGSSLLQRWKGIFFAASTDHLPLHPPKMSIPPGKLLPRLCIYVAVAVLMLTGIHYWLLYSETAGKVEHHLGTFCFHLGGLTANFHSNL